MPTNSFTKYLPAARYKDTTRIEFWSEEHILYIRLTEMPADFKPRLQSEITKYKDKVGTINKIIIDLRDNPGCEDHVWIDLFADLIDAPISYPLKIDDYQHSMMTKGKIESFGVKAAAMNRDHNPLLKKYDFYTIVDTTETLEASPASIRFKGKIYVLAENHYSAAGNAMAVANANPSDQLVVVGRRTGVFPGIGFSPQTFILPVTQLQFRIAPSIEVTNAKTLKDLMHDEMEVMVPYDLADYKARFQYRGSPTDKAFLLQYDPFTREVLKR